MESKMAKKGGVKNNRGSKKGKTNTSKKNASSIKGNKRGWSDVFDNVTYSSGPGDNIYVFG